MPSKRKAAEESEKRTKRQLTEMDSEYSESIQDRDKPYITASLDQSASSTANHGNHGKGSGYHWRRTFNGSEG